MNANYYRVTEEQAAAMSAAMDEAAKAFWAYPGEEWQLAFESQWLREQGLANPDEEPTT